MLYCRSIVLGIAEAAASIGRNKTDSRFCVAYSFNFEVFQREFLGISSDGSFTADVAEERFLRRISVTDRDGEDCGWPGQRSLQGLAEDCRWAILMVKGFDESMFRELLLRSGARNIGELKRKVSQNIARCRGYILGFLSASIISEELDANPAFCVEEDDLRNDFGGRPARVIAIGHGLMTTADSKPKRAKEPVSSHLYDIVVEQFPCPSAGPGT